MDNIIFNTLGLFFLGAVAVTGYQNVADGLEQQTNHVAHCLDQAGEKYSTCG